MKYIGMNIKHQKIFRKHQISCYKIKNGISEPNPLSMNHILLLHLPKQDAKKEYKAACHSYVM